MSSSGRIITSADILDGTITSADIADGTIVNADVATAAAIAASKLAAGGTANRVLATADGTTTAMQQLVSAMITDGTIATADLALEAATHASFTAFSVTSTNSTSFVDIAGATADFVSDGNRVYVFLTFITLSAAGAAVSLTVNINEAGSDTISALYQETLPLSTNSTKAYFGPLNGVWTGSRTIKLRWQVASGASTVNLVGGRMLLIEFKR